MKFGLLDLRESGEYSGVGFAEVSKISMMHDAIFQPTTIDRTAAVHGQLFANSMTMVGTILFQCACAVP